MGLFFKDKNIIKASKAEKYFNDLLQKAGFSAVKPDPVVAWNIFKEFSKVKVDCADDSLLFQCGVYNFTGEDLFHWSLVRQFSFEKHGEYDHMEQLECVIYYAPCLELKNIETNLWSSDCDSIDDFFKRVENLKEFQIIFKDYKPLKADIQQEEV